MREENKDFKEERDGIEITGVDDGTEDDEQMQVRQS